MRRLRLGAHPGGEPRQHLGIPEQRIGVDLAVLPGGLEVLRVVLDRDVLGERVAELGLERLAGLPLLRGLDHRELLRHRPREAAPDVRPDLLDRLLLLRGLELEHRRDVDERLGVYPRIASVW
jgi:hypothetical protein